MATFNQNGDELQEVVVTAQRINPRIDELPEVVVRAPRFNFDDLLRPPNLYYLIGAGVVALLMSDKPKRRRR